MNQTLVHIAAPSSFHDDCRYRAQADAILQTFYPTVLHGQNNQENENENGYSLPHDPLLAPARLAPDSFDSPVSVIPESPLASLKRSPPASSPERNPKRPCPPPQAPDPQIEDEQELLKTPLTINPPQPPIASAPFTTHITPTLSLLANRLNLARTFVPAHQARPLHVLERGYWWLRLCLRFRDPLGSGLGTRYPRPSGRGWSGLGSGASTATIAHANNAAAGVNPNTWDRELFSRFWGFLEDLIAKEGRAGWGVWCVLEREERMVESGTDRDLVLNRGRDLHSHPIPHPPNPDAGNFVLKVYTWGEIAPHVYLLLYLASERRIRGMGAQWCDASEGVVIQMA